MSQTQQPAEVQVLITKENTMALLIRLFKALDNAFKTETEPGTVRAFELIEMLTETAEKDPDVFKSILTEENIASFTRLQKKAATGSVKFTDLIEAFPAIGGAMKGGMFAKMFG